MACHVRRVTHPIYGEVIGVASIRCGNGFTPALLAALPKRARALDMTHEGIFVLPRWEPQLVEVAGRYFGAGLFWDEKMFPGLPGWGIGPRPGARTSHKRGPRRGGGGSFEEALRTLGVRAEASLEEALGAYRRKAMEVHPDRPGGSTEKMREVNLAWEVVRERLG